MAQGDLDSPGLGSATTTSPRRPIWAQGLACLAILPLIGFVGGKGWSLWDEYRGLRGDEVSSRANRVIGYVDITPNPSLAGRPANWLHDEGAQTLLWAGYRDDEHRWFRVGQGELDREKLSTPIGRDSIRTIDHPLYEQAGGRRWDLIPDEADMVGLDLGDEPPVYPIRVLDKVVAINDRHEDRSILVVYTPIKGNVAIFDADLDGQAIIMGQSGYFIGYSPVLYDRETESLWVGTDEAMAAVAGPRKGARLPMIAKVVRAAWGDWKANHPRTRLVVGADRSKAAQP